jgi:hypothetical protein
MQVEEFIPRSGFATTAARQQFGFGGHASVLYLKLRRLNRFLAGAFCKSFRLKASLSYCITVIVLTRTA